MLNGISSKLMNLMFDFCTNVLLSTCGNYANCKFVRMNFENKPLNEKENNGAQGRHAREDGQRQHGIL